MYRSSDLSHQFWLHVLVDEGSTDFALHLPDEQRSNVFMLGTKSLLLRVMSLSSGRVLFTIKKVEFVENVCCAFINH